MNAEFQQPPQTPLRPVDFDPARLDEKTRDYLRAIHRLAGKGANGGYCGRGSIWPYVGLVVGLGAMVAAIYLMLPLATGISSIREPGLQMFRTVILAIGVLFFLACLRSILRRRGEKYLGDFTFVDGVYLWDVKPARVRVTPIHTVVEARGTHHLTNGAYNYTNIQLSAPEGGMGLMLHNRAGADDVIMFINACAHLRSQNGGALAHSPELVAEVARKLLDNRLGEVADLGKGPAIPQPVGAAPSNFLMRNAALGAAVAAAALLGLFVMPPAGEYLADEQCYAAAKNSSESDVYSCENYLRDFPEGRHAAEMKDLLDDRRWNAAITTVAMGGIELSLIENYLNEFPKGRHAAEAIEELDHRRWRVAEQRAKEYHSPATLRDYLADARNNLHRADAQKLIDTFYDEAIARLKSLSEGQEAVDPQLSGGLLALLESLKTSPRPVVTIGFAAQRELEPEYELVKVREAEEYAQYLTENPGLKDIENASATHTAILPLGDVFTDEQIQRREQFILDRVKEAIAKVLDADLIAFEAAAPGDTPALLVEYHSYPLGNLYLYTHTETDSSGTETSTARGLLRGYDVDWKLTIRPKAEGETFVYELASKPGESLYYRPESSDPNWAVYAIIMYSAFHDFSGKLISGFGLAPPTAPVSFSFADATGTSDTSPTISYEPAPTYDPANPYATNPYATNPSGTNPEWTSPYNSSAFNPTYPGLNNPNPSVFTPDLSGINPALTGNAGGLDSQFNNNSGSTIYSNPQNPALEALLKEFNAGAATPTDSTLPQELLRPEIPDYTAPAFPEFPSNPEEVK